MESIKNVAIITGGNSSEIVISRKTAENILTNLDHTRYRCILITIIGKEWIAAVADKEYAVDKNDFTILTPEERIDFDCVFIAIHGTPGEDGKLQGYFDLLEIPYTTPSLLNTTLTFSKWHCNTLLKQMGIKCAGSYLVRKGDPISPDAIAKELGLPCFIKPNNAGSSFGISKVKKIEGILPAIEKAFGEDAEVLIESAMIGREVTCGVLNFKGAIKALPITEIISNNEFFDFEAKYNGASQEITPANLTPEITNEVQAIVVDIYHRLNMTGIIRIDFILQQDGPYVIEINTVPGLTVGSLIPQQAEASGIPLADLFSNAIEQAILNSQKA
jgi:D-alanine-D-alanine ligase